MQSKRESIFYFTMMTIHRLELFVLIIMVFDLWIKANLLCLCVCVLLLFVESFWLLFEISLLTNWFSVDGFNWLTDWQMMCEMRVNKKKMFAFYFLARCVYFLWENKNRILFVHFVEKTITNSAMTKFSSIFDNVRAINNVINFVWMAHQCLASSIRR